MNDLRNLRVLDASYVLVTLVHAASRTLDVTVTPGLRAQLLRAVDAVPANITEGARQATRAQFARYLRIALGSADECGAHLKVAYLAEALDLVTYRRCQSTRGVLCKMLTQLLRSVEAQAAHERGAQRRV
jgi:four helix bundle protein